MNETATVFPSPAIPWWRVGVILVLTAAAIGACFIGQAPVLVSESGIVMDLPQSIESFWGTNQEVSESERVILPKDTEFAKKLYQDGAGNTVNAQIVLAGAEKRSIHRPEVCLPGQGWTLKTGRVLPVKLDNGKTLDVMMLTIARPVMLSNGQQKELTSLFLYWFVGKDATTPHHLLRILKTNLDMLLHNTNHRWAYVIVSAPVLEGLVPGGKSQEKTQELLEQFIAKLAPQIMKPGVIPETKE